MFSIDMIVRARAITLCLLCVFTIVSCSLAQQQVQIDWITKSPVSPAITVDKSTPIVVVVRSVNDMLYSYSERVVATPRSPIDIQPLEKLFGALPDNDPCKELVNALDALDTAFNKPELKPDVQAKELPKSIPLENTKAAYDAARKEIDALSTKVGCSEQKILDRRDFYVKSVKPDWDQAEQRSHTFTFPTTLEPMNDYSFFVREQYKGTTTDHCTNKDDAGKTVGVECEIQYKPVSSLITASGGFLITQLTSPTYDRSNVPDGSGAVLTIANNGAVRSAFTALINVHIPFCSFANGGFGCAISVGPAFALGSNSNTSSIGLFSGLSLHLWRYLYLTPGVHIGQYPGLPAGFTHAGQPIPASFTGKLDPINRTSARFAIGITFKGWNLVNNNSTSQGTPSNGKPTTVK